MLIIRFTCILPLLCLAPLASAKLRRRGWLDKLVAYHKRNFIEDLARLPASLTVTLEKAPPGYTDAPGWDWDAVLRLVLLVETLDVPAWRAIRRALQPSRRVLLPAGVNTFQLFPSWSQFSANDYHYDDMVSYDDSPAPYDVPAVDNDTVLYISNPLEARLPSARITIGRLREVMESEARRRREMPSTAGSSTTYSWTHKSSTTTQSAAASEEPAESSGTAGPSTEPPGETSSAAGGSTSVDDTAPHASTEASQDGSKDENSENKAEEKNEEDKKEEDKKEGEETTDTSKAEGTADSA